MEDTANPNEGAQLSAMDMLGNYLEKETAEQSPPPQEKEKPDPVAEPEDEPTEAEADADSTEQTEDAESDFEEVEFDGEAYQLPKKLKDALMRQRDYQVKTSEVAQLRKQADSQIETAKLVMQSAQEMQQFSGEMAMIDSQLGRYEKLDWEALQSNDPLQYMEALSAVNLLQSRRAQVDATAKAKWHELQTKAQSEVANRIKQTHEQVRKRIKGYSDETDKKLGQYIAARNLDGDALRTVRMSPELVELSYKAMRYDEMQSKNPQAKRVLPSPVKPGATPGQKSAADSEARKKSWERLSKSGSLRDAASLIKL